MTKSEARKHLGLRENDNIRKDGILELITITEKQLSVWDHNWCEKEKLEKDLEAYRTLIA